MVSERRIQRFRSILWLISSINFILPISSSYWLCTFVQFLLISQIKFLFFWSNSSYRLLPIRALLHLLLLRLMTEHIHTTYITSIVLICSHFSNFDRRQLQFTESTNADRFICEKQTRIHRWISSKTYLFRFNFQCLDEN